MNRTLLKIYAGLLIVIAVLISPVTPASAKKHKNKDKSSPAGSAAEGKAVFDKNCAMCHSPDKADKKIGPGLKDLFKNKELPESHKAVTEENVREQIEKGSPKAKPMPMPAFADKLARQEMQNLLVYLKTL